MLNVNSLKLTNIYNCVWKPIPLSLKLQLWTLDSPYGIFAGGKKSNGLYLPSFWALIKTIVSGLLSRFDPLPGFLTLSAVCGS